MNWTLRRAKKRSRMDSISCEHKHALDLLVCQRCPLTSMHMYCIFMRMRTTLNIDDALLERASRLTGIKEKTALVRLGLETLIARESSKRLAKLGGTENSLRSIPRTTRVNMH
ncbi:MAG: type II toxin-antitoxin system VapB family antitoxin [Desulfobacterales bacterium]